MCDLGLRVAWPRRLPRGRRRIAQAARSRDAGPRTPMPRSAPIPRPPPPRARRACGAWGVALANSPPRASAQVPSRRGAETSDHIRVVWFVQHRGAGTCGVWAACILCGKETHVRWGGSSAWREARASPAHSSPSSQRHGSPVRNLERRKGFEVCACAEGGERGEGRG